MSEGEELYLIVHTRGIFIWRVGAVLCMVRTVSSVLFFMFRSRIDSFVHIHVYIFNTGDATWKGSSSFSNDLQRRAFCAL